MFQPGRNLSILPESCPTCQTLSQNQHTQPLGLLPWPGPPAASLSGNGRPTHPRPARSAPRRLPKRIAIRLGLVRNRFVDPPEKPIFLPPTFAFDPSHPRAPFVPLHSASCLNPQAHTGARQSPEWVLALSPVSRRPHQSRSMQLGSASPRRNGPAM